MKGAKNSTGLKLLAAIEEYNEARNGNHGGDAPLWNKVLNTARTLGVEAMGGTYEPQLQPQPQPQLQPKPKMKRRKRSKTKVFLSAERARLAAMDYISLATSGPGGRKIVGGAERIAKKYKITPSTLRRYAKIYRGK